MKIPRVLWFIALVCRLVPSGAFAQITFQAVPAPGNGSVSLSGASLKVNDIISLYQLAKPAAGVVATCDAAGIATAITLNITTTAAIPAPVAQLVAPAAAGSFPVTLGQPLGNGINLCVQDFGPLGGPPPAVKFSAVQGVIVPPAPAPLIALPMTPTKPRFDTELVAGSKTVTVKGYSQDQVSIYQFDVGYNVGDCSATGAGILNRRTELPIVSPGSTPTAQTTSVPLTNSTLTLGTALVAGTTLCIAETANGADPNWSVPVVVPYPNDNGLFSPYFVGGVQASNQLSGTNSSTAGTYFEVGFNSTVIRASQHTWSGARTHPGLSTNVDVRLSPIPVTASTTTATTSSSGSTSAVTTPNQLSSQQAVRFVASIYAPMQWTSWNHGSDYFTIAPVARSGFGTLLNPSAGSNASTSGTTQASTTSAVFSPNYYFYSGGIRLAWDRYPKDRKEAPQMMTQFLLTFGQFSNLPNDVCKATTVAPATGTTVNSACPQSTAAPYYFDSRILIPRIDVEGIAKLPGYPFLMGIDANLPQYVVGIRNNLDYQSKPGTDIRIYVGFELDLSTLATKLGITSP